MPLKQDLREPSPMKGAQTLIADFPALFCYIRTPNRVRVSWVYLFNWQRWYFEFCWKKQNVEAKYFFKEMLPRSQAQTWVAWRIDGRRQRTAENYNLQIFALFAMYKYSQYAQYTYNIHNKFTFTISVSIQNSCQFVCSAQCKEASVKRWHAVWFYVCSPSQ